MKVLRTGVADSPPDLAEVLTWNLGDEVLVNNCLMTISSISKANSSNGIMWRITFQDNHYSRTFAWDDRGYIERSWTDHVTGYFGSSSS